MILEGIFLLGLVPAIAATKDTQMSRDAVHFATQAYYQQSGMDEKAEYLEKRYIKKEFRAVGAWIVWGAGIAYRRKITYSWEF